MLASPDLTQMLASPDLTQPVPRCAGGVLTKKTWHGWRLTGEVPAARHQRFPDGRHGQHDVQVVGALVDEELPDALLGGSTARLHGFTANLRNRRVPTT